MMIGAVLIKWRKHKQSRNKEHVWDKWENIHSEKSHLSHFSLQAFTENRSGDRITNLHGSFLDLPVSDADPEDATVSQRSVTVSVGGPQWNQDLHFKYTHNMSCHVHDTFPV